MQRRIAFVLAWIAITGVSVFVATQAVGALREQVTDTPATLPPVVAATTVAKTTGAPESASTPAPTSILPTTPDTTILDGTESTTTTSTVPTEPPPSSTTTTTMAPPPTTTSPPTTTTAPTAMETATYQLTGGWVRIRYGGGEVHVVDAAPYAGYTMKPEKTGPLKVEIEFEGDGYEGKFKADMEDGALDVDIEESNGEDDD